MSVQVILENHEVVLKITGWTALASLRKEIKIPYASIQNVQIGNFDFPWGAVKRAGISVPYGYKAGNFLHEGHKYFLSFHDSTQVVMLDLKESEFDKVVIQSQAPEELVDLISKNCSYL
ncbi:hypothetical protein [Paenibacillus sp. FSL H8-0034]|uniref:hypothetical protein n=1 Tax=Paenibacillus sp. FSL H8-0034 TaxID=2954671 RepID=UPI0030F5AACA